MTLKQSPYASGITELLLTLDSSHLYQLASTATNQHLIADSKKEAVDIILRYTENLERFFSYKRITCQVLFDYLHKKKVPLRVGESKQEMIQRVKKEWEKKQNAKPVTKSVSLPNTKKNQIVNSFPVAVPQRHRSNTELNVNYSGASNAASTTAINLNLTTQDVQLSVKLTHGSGGGGGGGGGVVRSDVFAREFCKWFFVMLNRLHPQGAAQAGDNFSPDVFMANCTMDIYLCDTNNTEKHATGHNNAYVLLKNVCTDFRLMFVPHIDSGVRAEMSQHGLVKLYCLGTLHQGDAFVGVFEQEFGLVKSPQEGWKIMMTKINLKQAQQDSVCLPALPQGPVFEIPS
ncbi:uncharacterized protein E2C01_030077 [Portunus trituberculatus]|uniref:Uncharacterized protein n=1 Tax=Portunus trituberculatus TaxID=210409 RepID=A0A5B7EUR4_PORTR|nr:uncharacterized protein [Portunus trituberculatus]